MPPTSAAHPAPARPFRPVPVLGRLKLADGGQGGAPVRIHPPYRAQRGGQAGAGVDVAAAGFARAAAPATARVAQRGWCQGAGRAAGARVRAGRGEAGAVGRGQRERVVRPGAACAVLLAPAAGGAVVRGGGRAGAVGRFTGFRGQGGPVAVRLGRRGCEGGREEGRKVE